MLLLGIAIALIVVLLLAILVMHAMGRALPVEHTAIVSIRLQQPPEAAWDVLAEIAAYPKWTTTTSVLQLPSDDPDHPLFRQSMGRNSFVLRRSRAERPRVLQFTIEDDAKMFSGDWTYTIEPAAAGAKGCTVTLTEHGRVPHAIPRFFMKYIFGTQVYIRKQLAALAKKFGETTQPG
jgi:hypothetical protein